GRAIAPEDVAGAWEQIVDFDGEVNYPRDAMNAVQPVLDNLKAGPSKGGNQYIDVDAALGHRYPVSKTSYDQRDLALYALAVGAAQDPLDAQDLKLVYELHSDGFRGLPTFGVIPVINAIIEHAKRGELGPGLNFGAERILHGEQRLEVRHPLPPKATLTHKLRIRDIWDKGKHALVVFEGESVDETGAPIFVNEFTLLIRGAGGWGGERGPSTERNTPPAREPDAVTEQTLAPNQAILYRLTGDLNPLHIDPAFAKAFGFDRPILHGLCTFGHVGRHVINAFAGGDPRLMRSIDARFADSVFPGETLVTEMWRESDTRVIVRAKVKERDSVVISNAAVELHTEVPKRIEAPKKAPAAAAPAKATVISADVFTAMGGFIAQSAGLVEKIGKVFQFRLTGPDSVWTVDLKQGAGAVTAGDSPKPDCTLELADSDFLAMTRGEADPQKLYFGGKLKISGDIMASQKLTFLGKLDPAQVSAAANARAGGGAAAPEAAPAAPAGSPSGDVFIAIRDHVERHPELAEKIGKVFQFKLVAPDSVWTINLKAAPGSVDEGESTKPDCTLELSDADFVAMTRGEADAQKLYFSGKLKIAGDIMASQKLKFLQDIDPAKAKEAVERARAGCAANEVQAPAAQAKPAAPSGPGFADVMKALEEKLAESPGLAAEVGALLVMREAGGDAWTVDLREGAAARVTAGATDGAAATFTLDAGALAALARGEQTARQLFQRGTLQVAGDVLLGHRLDMLFAGLA
ncbi:MAG: SCP2 sterol-binding domain-containing protein, partial [Myxococcales bacterium]|nr:SCP2 sterol-binding domain-containing protein [Myxococcales bacterium]